MPSCSCTNSLACTQRQRRGGVFSLELLEERPGFVLARVRGKGARKLFMNEAGGHRWQRVPPTEKRGRVHTSTVTVAVLPEPTARELRIHPDELEETFTGGSGKGGQHQNKRSTAVVLVHKPTGIRVRIESRSQHANRQTALEVLRARLKSKLHAEAHHRHNAQRHEQVGSGMRADKIRTVQVRNGLVVDHRTGKRTSFRRYEAGHLADLQ